MSTGMSFEVWKGLNIKYRKSHSKGVINQLFWSYKISMEEARSLDKLIDSDDPENLEIAEGIIADMWKKRRKYHTTKSVKP